MNRAILELNGITKAFDGINAVYFKMSPEIDERSRNSSAQDEPIVIGIDKGKIVGLIGPNGAGKTTVFNMISGIIKPDEGEIYYKQTPITALPPWKIANLGIGRLFQDVHIFSQLSVLDNVMVAFKNQTGENPFKTLFFRLSVKKNECERHQKALELLNFVGLKKKAEENADNLSFGQQKLLSIARLLAADSDLLLLDEPTAGVNQSMIKKLLRVIKNLASNGKTILFIEHNMNVVIEIADFVYFLNEGQKINFGTPDDVLCTPEVRNQYLGI